MLDYQDANMARNSEHYISKRAGYKLYYELITFSLWKT